MEKFTMHMTEKDNFIETVFAVLDKDDIPYDAKKLEKILSDQWDNCTPEQREEAMKYALEEFGDYVHVETK